jgi:hypothetical protein
LARSQVEQRSYNNMFDVVLISRHMRVSLTLMQLHFIIIKILSKFTRRTDVMVKPEVGTDTKHSHCSVDGNCSVLWKEFENIC